MQIVELYEFTVGDINTDLTAGTYWHTSSSKAYIYNGKTYTPVPLGRSNVQQTNELSKCTLDVTIGISTPLAQTLFASAYLKKVAVKITRIEGASTRLIYSGSLSCINPSKAELVLTFNNFASRMRRNGLRRPYSRSCGLVFSSTECSAQPHSYSYTGEVITFDERLITLPTGGESFYSNWCFTGAYFRLETEVRMITKVIDLLHFEIQYPFTRGTSPNSIFTIYSGCDKSMRTCKSYNNAARYGGFLYMSVENPYTSSDGF